MAAAHPDLLAIRGFTPSPSAIAAQPVYSSSPPPTRGCPTPCWRPWPAPYPASSPGSAGPHELILDGRSGAAFPTDDADGLGEAIATVTGAPGEALGQAARALAAGRLDIERKADGYEARTQRS